VKTIVLDASAMLAVLNDEPGSEKLTPDMLKNSIGSTVNLAEVHTKLVSRGGDPDEAWEDALSAIQRAVPFDEEQARIAGGLVGHTRAFGLSLGDRACLALGFVLNAPVYTTDRYWKDLKVGVRIHVIR
jgi:PIN domain nuclease of toxin-antitoxin system